MKKRLAIRSSAASEDTQEKSNAGAFKKRARKVDPENLKSVSNAVCEVFDSYGFQASSKDEIIIQEMVSNVMFSGVLFTHELKNGAPYYSINYDDVTGKTNTVTAGLDSFSNKTLYVHRDNISKLRSTRFIQLLSTVVEIEKLLGSSHLDIEFIVQNDFTVNIVQVRPIVNVHKIDARRFAELNSTMYNLQRSLKKQFFDLHPEWGRTTIYGQMPDWNPAELIGLVPRQLSCSLYARLITDGVWAEASRNGLL